MIDFQNTEIAFKAKSNADLKRAHWLFRAIGKPWLVSSGSWLATTSLKLGLPVKGLIRATVFKQFCGGESIPACASAISVMNALGVQSILDYSVEGKETEKDFERTCEKTIETIRFGKDNPGLPLAVFKPTGMSRNALMEKVSNGQALTPAEEQEWGRVRERFRRIAKTAAELRQPVMIDAEETWIQPAADALAEELMKEFNTDGCWVYTTLQMYRHDRLEYLRKLGAWGREQGIKVGVKIVRGAYMEKERDRAEELGYPSPIQPDKTSTDRDYNEALRYILDNLDLFYLVAGTHNEESAGLLVKLMEEKGTDKRDPRVYFSQLYGMSDHISFNLAAAGYHVVKYLPFGPVEDVLPYLIRRAEENTSVAGQTGRELRLIREELRRRKKSGTGR